MSEQNESPNESSSDRPIRRRGDRPGARFSPGASGGHGSSGGSGTSRTSGNSGGSDRRRSGDERRGESPRRGDRQGGRRFGSDGGRGGPRRDGGSRPTGGSRGPIRDSAGRSRAPRESTWGDDERRARLANEPAIPDDISASDLEPEARGELRSLDKANAETVARHLVAAMYLIDTDPERALEHGRAAKARAGRIGVVRETVGVLAYRASEWAEALGELRAARRISGGPGLLALMADCERGLERPDRAIELARSEGAADLDPSDRLELRIVEAGARMDLDQLDAALVTLQDAGLDPDASGEEAARLDYAYAEVLVAASRKDEARSWFERAIAADPEATLAESRLAELE